MPRMGKVPDHTLPELNLIHRRLEPDASSLLERRMYTPSTKVHPRLHRISWTHHNILLGSNHGLLRHEMSLRTSWLELLSHWLLLILDVDRWPLICLLPLLVCMGWRKLLNTEVSFLSTFPSYAIDAFSGLNSVDFDILMLLYHVIPGFCILFVVVSFYWSILRILIIVVLDLPLFESLTLFFFFQVNLLWNQPLVSNHSATKLWKFLEVLCNYCCWSFLFLDFNIFIMLFQLKVICSYILGIAFFVRDRFVCTA